MNSQIIIAVDAMGGDDSPNKVIEGVSIHSKTSNDVYYKIFGDIKRSGETKRYLEILRNIMKQ